MTTEQKIWDRRTFLRTGVAGLGVSMQERSTPTPAPRQKSSGMYKQLSKEHMAAVNRRRRVIVNYDVLAGLPYVDRRFSSADIKMLTESYLDFVTKYETQVDSIWWCWGEGNSAYYPSKILAVIDTPGYRQLFANGIVPMRVFLEETKKLGREVFFSYRVNGGDFGKDNPISSEPRPPLKQSHPEWLIPWDSTALGHYNFEIEEVRDHKLSILREVAENFDFDGIDLDFARFGPMLTPGHQWENREKLTEFARSVRRMLLEVEQKRGRPFLLSARVPENIEGCHVDGFDVETWARENLVDIFVLGCRSLDVDIAAFRRITTGTQIKLYPSLDDNHSSDGYAPWDRSTPQLEYSIEFLRGVFANWWSQEADGIQSFNFNMMTPEVAARSGISRYSRAHWVTHYQAYREMGSPETLKYRSKVFVVQRRGGGGIGKDLGPDPEDWSTPRLCYFNTNMFAPLPAKMANNGKADALLSLYTGEDITTDLARIKSLTLRVLLSDPAAEGLPQDQRIERGAIRKDFYNFPPAKGVEDLVEVRLNNILLGYPRVEQGWLVFSLKPKYLALGPNLVGLRVIGRPPNVLHEMSIEKLELHVKYL